MTPTPPTTRFIVMNRPHGEPQRYRAKGSVQLMDAGTVSVKTRTERNGHMYFDVTPTLVLDMISALCPDANHDMLVQLLQDYGVDTPKTLAKTLLENFYVYPHMTVGEDHDQRKESG